MRKIDKIYENPIDNVLVYICEKVAPFFKQTGHTPNIITTYSFIFGLMSLHYLYSANIHKFAICFALGYFMDNLDGYMARQYKMTSKFGDLYDHATDVIVGMGLVYAINNLYKNELTLFIVVCSLFIVYLSMKHLGCQQANITKSGESLDAFDILCDTPEDIKWTRYAGAGTLNLYVVLLIYYLHNKKTGV